MCPSLIQIGSKTAEKNSAQTNRHTDKQTDRHYENNGHLAVNQNWQEQTDPGSPKTAIITQVLEAVNLEIL